MGKRSFALGVLTALAAAAATEDHSTYTTPATTHTYVQGGTPAHRVVYTTSPLTIKELACVAFDKMMKVNKVYTISESDRLYETGKELRRIYLEDETVRTVLNFDERKAVRKVMDAYNLPIGDAKTLAFRFGRLVHSSLV